MVVEVAERIFLPPSFSLSLSECLLSMSSLQLRLDLFLHVISKLARKHQELHGDVTLRYCATYLLFGRV